MKLMEAISAKASKLPLSPKGEPYKKLHNLHFDNTALRELPIDKETSNDTRQVRGAFFSRLVPTPVYGPELVSASLPALQLLELDPSEIDNPEFVEFMSGNKILPGSEPAAHCYCGQLGDGRAIYLGEIVNGKSERWEIQLKGAGQTPYSRTADGRAVLRSSIREFLCSEAMYYLGIPTTRAGCIVTSDNLAIRDIKYDGHPIKERVTVCLRIAPTFIRFGSFEICKPSDPMTGRGGPSVGMEKEMLPTLLSYIIKYHYPDLIDGEPKERYLAFYTEVVRRTALMVAEWQSVGFCHGVMNTDNMSILGLTIDYGPFAFLDAYDPDFICNGSDDGGRYSYKNQPEICSWNLGKLREALAPVLPLSQTEQAWENFKNLYEEFFFQKMKKKLGLSKEMKGDQELINSLLKTMQSTGADFTNVFSKIPIPSESPETVEKNDPNLAYILSQLISLRRLMKSVGPSIPPQQLQMLAMLARSNPQMLAMIGKSPEYILSQIEKVERQQELKNKTQEDKDKEDLEQWSNWLLLYKKRLWLEVEGVSSSEKVAIAEKRVQVMNSTNPKFVLRNWIAQAAIQKAEKGDYSQVNEILSLLRDPYGEGLEFADRKYDSLPPDWALDICITCSS